MMEGFESKDDLEKAGNHFFRHLAIYEVISLVLIVAGIVLNIFHKPGRILITVTLVLLALIYFFRAFAKRPYQAAGKIERNVFMFNSWMLSIAVIGFMFLWNRLPMAGTLALVGSIPLLLVVLVMLIMKNRKPDSETITLLNIIRSFIIGLVVLIYYLLTFHQYS